ncbi:MAG: hypothetical protein M1812_006578 [Candelaria pacifica]|nr:MAG: hypothetical protein M1812_006578 [Candelaria pacifica]
MDPLSIAAGVVGLITAATQVSKLLTTITKLTKAAPKLAQITLTEVNDIKAILTHLQAFLLGTATASRDRASLILVEQVIVTLTGCVTTFSELDEILNDLTTDGAMSSLDRVKWAMKESSIAAIVQRLQTHKASITLMLTILDCRSNDEAQQSMNRLCNLFEQFLQTNEDMSKRLRTLEAGPKAQENTIKSSVHDDEDDSEEASTITPVASSQENSQDVPRSAYGFAFDEDLQNSKVYKRTLYSNSGESLVSSAARTTASSVLSGLSLADVSVVSVYALPVYANEISNRQFYTFGGQPGKWEEKLPESTESPSLENNGPQSLLSRPWNSRDRLPRRIQGILWQGEPSTNQLVQIAVEPPVSQLGISSPPSKRFNASRLRATFRRQGSGSANFTTSTPPAMVFGVPLAASIKYANVAIFLSDGKGTSYVYGYVPIVVAKCGVFLKEKGTSEKDIFRRSGNPERMWLLQKSFDSPKEKYGPYGKGLDWTGYTVHDCSSILLRYLNQLPDPLVPRESYENFREPLRKNAKSVAGTFKVEAEQHPATINAYQKLIRDLPPLNRQLLLYILDALAVFASKSELNSMTSASLAVIFQAGILSPPLEDVLDNQAQDVLIFLIENQDHFLMDIEGLMSVEEFRAKQRQEDSFNI